MQTFSAGIFVSLFFPSFPLNFSQPCLLTIKMSLFSLLPCLSLTGSEYQAGGFHLLIIVCRSHVFVVVISPLLLPCPMTRDLVPGHWMTGKKTDTHSRSMTRRDLVVPRRRGHKSDNLTDQSLLLLPSANSDHSATTLSLRLILSFSLLVLTFC